MVSHWKKPKNLSWRLKITNQYRTWFKGVLWPFLPLLLCCNYLTTFYWDFKDNVIITTIKLQKPSLVCHCTTTMIRGSKLDNRPQNMLNKIKTGQEQSSGERNWMNSLSCCHSWQKLVYSKIKLRVLMNACIHFFCFKSSSHKQRTWYQISYFVEKPSDCGTHNGFFITSFFGRISYCL